MIVTTVRRIAPVLGAAWLLTGASAHAQTRPTDAAPPPTDTQKPPTDTQKPPTAKPAALSAPVDIGAPAPAPEAASATDTQAPANAAPPANTPAARRRYTHALHPYDTSPNAPIGDTRYQAPPGLFGDWRKTRTYLGKRGIAVSARYASESAWNVTGGEREKVTETGQFDVGAKFDLDTIAGIDGGTFQATVTWRRGRNLSDDAGLNTLQQVQEVYGRGQTVRVTELWYQQKLGDQVEVKLGRTNPGADFAVFSCHFMNLTFCGAQPGNLVGDYWTNWPIAQWAGILHADVGHGAYVQIGGYVENPNDLKNSFFIARFRGANGVLIPVEAGWTRGLDGGHVGAYKIGGWYSTTKGDDVLLDIDRRPIVITGLAPLRHSGRYGVFASMQQQITGMSKDGKALTGLGVFANVTQADRATSVTDNQVALGVFYKGLLPGVSGDVLGVAVGRTNVNGRAAQADTLVPGTPVRDAEYAAELYYSITPVPWLELQPNVQLIHHPGGVKTLSDVGVLGLKAAITL
ncbi:carbohydrate porin [Sphingomonas sp. BAUL-RG-20F-R05-02]|uniref:carbohydrate porin n=1 Tax=Sphingomonas sp. BAUL-RG-20F-R05-02 TaxID=2914830 RepID=UPI001F595AE8|nr:carbohydrate porin [Sphingomonas sp. BAUL-RG-20F-R05-02]